MTGKIDKWLRSGPEAILRKAGLREGNRVVDFGCREGRYAMSAARIVGDFGWVQAVDIDKKILRKVKRQAAKKGLTNVNTVHIAQHGAIPVRAGTIDVILLYDVLHGWYFPEKAQRDNLLRQVHRCLRPGGVLSCCLTHLRQFGWTYKEILAEIKDAGFRLNRQFRPTLVHDDKLVRIRIFQFTKPG
ncbi:MAG: class I SAM-dependent methyltransferase [Phycisphaerae bacterium]|nr:class I SAM-dependent methyltransferase [Phycisphaerae bacterium]